jgi:hypothetical protein
MLRDRALIQFSTFVFYFGDFDPNGSDMTRDLQMRLRRYTGEPVEVRRLALTMEQVEQYRLPPFPAKETDSRYAAYVSEFGTTDSWELDALDPA